MAALLGAVGGAAALVKGVSPSFSASQIQSFLEGRAIDKGAPGKDNDVGSGVLSLGSPPVGPTCSPRPQVNISSTVSGGRLAVTVSTSGTGNFLSSIAFSNGGRTPANALLDLPDGRTGVTGSPTLTLPSGTTSTTFFVRRQTAGQPTTVPFTVTGAAAGQRSSAAVRRLASSRSAPPVVIRSRHDASPGLGWHVVA